MLKTKMRGRRIGRGKKYGNKRIKTNHGTFDSEEEAERFSVLLQWQDEGRITDLRQGERIELHPAFWDMHGRKWTWHYTPDFVYTVPEYDIEVIEDYKSGHRPPEWRHKELIFRARFPDVHFFVNENIGGWYEPPESEELYCEG